MSVRRPSKPGSVRLLLLLFLSSFCASAALGQTWTLEGPSPAQGGQVENVPNSPISGAIEAIAAHPTDPDILWIGAVNGGIFRTDDATAASPSWTPQTDSELSLSIGALALDPTDGTNNTLVAGVGLQSSYGRLGGSRAGVLRTTNGGTTWTQLAGAGLSGVNITGIAARGNIIVVAVNTTDSGNLCSTLGIYRSTDTGASFTQISNNAGVTGLPCGFAWDLAEDPTDNTRLFTVATGLAAASDGLYRSTDTGANWTQVSSGTLDTLLQSTPSNAEISVGEAGGANANVFAAVCTSGQLAGLFHSQNAGTTWTSMDLPSTTEQGTSYGIHPGGQCGIHFSLQADPVDDDVVYIGGDRQPANNENGLPGVQFPNSIGASNYGGRLFKVDGGQTPGSQATPITNCGSAALAGCGGSARTANDTATHADSRKMVFDANGDLLQSDDGGIYRHTNPAGTTGDWESVVGNLSVFEQHNVVYDGTSDIILSGNQDNANSEQMATSNLVWDIPTSGDGGDVTVGEDDPVATQSTRYMSAQFLSGIRRRVYNAANALQSQAFPSLTPAGGSPAISPQFTTPLAINADDPTRLIVGGSNGVYESLDRLDSVTRLSGTAAAAINDFGGGGVIAYGIASNDDALYFGASDDVWVRTAAPPTAPTQTDPSAGSSDLIRGVVMDTGDATHAFAVDQNQVFETTNSGSNWTDITGNLFTSFSPGTVRSIEFVPGTNDRIVVGTQRGVFVADDTDFSSWSALGSGLPNALVLELDYDGSDELLVAGTLGRGAWSLDLSSGGGCAPDDAFEPDNSSGAASSINTGVAQTHKLCPAGDQDWVTFTLVAQSEVTLGTSSTNPDDPRLTLYDNGLSQIEIDDNSAVNGRDAFIDRTCASDPLPAGTYFVRADEAAGTGVINSYDLTYTLVGACASCPTTITLDNQSITGSQTETAQNVVLGANLTVTGTGNLRVEVSNRVTFQAGTRISGTLRVDTDPTYCP